MPITWTTLVWQMPAPAAMGCGCHFLSGGEPCLCRLLLSRPDMLLLDEPTNHLDAESVFWLEKFLDNFPAPWWRNPRSLLPGHVADWI